MNDQYYLQQAREDIEFYASQLSKEGANKSLGTKTHHSKLLILNG
ncbi:hypothetical protein KAM337_43590 [Aeromonas caviae]|nr:hypothetical protein KAM335_41720 [Aeromonas caviae]GJA25831.1 hypothetical protein KAM337_43590 [Aeromonas caviae]GJB22248.1 hypothetical protein KAM364_41600 [Aeromonas caviae]